MLSIDIYVNETTRHADVILPAPEPLEKSHYDAAFYQLSTRNIANYSAVFERQNPAEWEIYMRPRDHRGQGRTATSAHSTTWSSRR